MSDVSSFPIPTPQFFALTPRYSLNGDFSKALSRQRTNPEPILIPLPTQQFSPSDTISQTFSTLSSNPLSNGTTQSSSSSSSGSSTNISPSPLSLRQPVPFSDRLKPLDIRDRSQSDSTSPLRTLDPILRRIPRIKGLREHILSAVKIDLTDPEDRKGIKGMLDLPDSLLPFEREILVEAAEYNKDLESKTACLSFLTLVKTAAIAALFFGGASYVGSFFSTYLGVAVPITVLNGAVFGLSSYAAAKFTANDNKVKENARMNLTTNQNIMAEKIKLEAQNLIEIYTDIMPIKPIDVQNLLKTKKKEELEELQKTLNVEERVPFLNKLKSVVKDKFPSVRKQIDSNFLPKQSCFFSTLALCSNKLSNCYNGVKNCAANVFTCCKRNKVEKKDKDDNPSKVMRPLEAVAYKIILENRDLIPELKTGKKSQANTTIDPLEEQLLSSYQACGKKWSEALEATRRKKFVKVAAQLEFSRHFGETPTPTTPTLTPTPTIAPLNTSSPTETNTVADDSKRMRPIRSSVSARKTSSSPEEVTINFDFRNNADDNADWLDLGEFDSPTPKRNHNGNTFFS